MMIGNVLRALLGEVKPGDAKALELKAGQVVRGLVLKLLSDSDALIRIGGQTVAAKLAIPLTEGQVAALQVSPESTPDKIVLRAIPGTGEQMPRAAVDDLLAQLGLRDTSDNRRIVELLVREDIPLTKGNLRALQQAYARSAESGGSKEASEQAFVIAYRKGMPPAPAVLASLQSALDGAALHDRLLALDRALSAVLPDLTDLLDEADASENGGKDAAARPAKAPTAPPALSGAQVLPAPSREVRFLLQQAAELIARVKRLPTEALSSAAAGTDEPSSADAPSGSGTAIPSAAAAVAGDGSLRGTGRTDGLPRASAANQPTPPQTQGAAEPEWPVGEPEQRTTVRPESMQQEIRSPTVPTAQQAEVDLNDPTLMTKERTAAVPDDGPPAPVKTDDSGERMNAFPANRNESLVQDTQSAGVPPSGTGEPSWIKSVFRLLGLSHERDVLAFAKGLETAAGTDAAANGNGGGSDGTGPDLDSLKSVLVQLHQAAHELPPAVRDAVSPLLDQLTGQQLLMQAERGGVFSHITLRVPLFTPEGDQTAEVHIQSRKGRNGTLDPNNCRLLFDLHMQAMGDTLVDVQVVGRIVSVKVHNDTPEIAGLIGRLRNDMAESMGKIGFALSSLSTVSYAPGEPNPPSRKADAGGTPPLAGKPYRGVDFRI